jgi:hypothetical protein
MGKVNIHHSITDIQLKHDEYVQTLEMNTAFPIRNYSNNYLWNFVVTDVVYNLQRGYNTFFQIPHGFFAMQYKDDYSESIYSENNLFFKSERIKDDIVGFFGNYWDCESLIMMYCCSIDKTIQNFVDDYNFQVTFAKDGDGLLIHYSKSFQVDVIQTIIEETLLLYGLGVDVFHAAGGT